MSRQYTNDEMVDLFIDHLRGTARYCATCAIPAGCKPEHETEAEYRVNLLLFSFLVILDGGTDAPAFHVVPDPHPEDEQYHLDNGDDWWPTCTLEGIDDFSINGDVQLHELLHGRIKR